MKPSPSQTGSAEVAMAAESSAANAQPLLMARLQFVRQLIQGDLSFQDELPADQLEQNTLVKLAAILISKPGSGPFGDLYLHRVGSILKVLGARINHKPPSKLFLEFETYKQMQMLTQFNKLKPQQRLFAASITGLYPVVRVGANDAFPLMVPYLLQESGVTNKGGNRNWQMARRLLEAKFQTQAVQELRTKDQGLFLCYEILLGRISEEFGMQSWTHHLWRLLYQFYFKSCMELLVKESHRQKPFCDVATDERINQYSERSQPLRVEWGSLLSEANLRVLDRLSIKLIQTIVERDDLLMQEFQRQLVEFSRNQQYEDGSLKVMSILYKYTPHPSVRARVLELAENSNMVEAFLPLLSNDDEIVQYFERKRVIEPERIRNFPENLRNRLAESSLRLNPLSVMALEGSFRGDAMQLHVLKSLPSLPPEEMGKALRYIQHNSREAGFRTLVGTNNYHAFKEIIKEWELFHSRIQSQLDFLDVGNSLLKLLQSKQQSISNSRIELPPPRLCPVWLKFMLSRIFTMTEQIGFAPNFLSLSKQAVIATHPYLHKVLRSEGDIAEVYQMLSKVLCRDPSLILELSHI